MSLAEDLRGKLDAARDDLSNLQSRLHEIASLEESLRATSGHLADTSSQVSELVASAREAQKSLDLTVKALEQATEVMMRLEPAVITSAIEESSKSTKEAMAENSSNLALHVSEQSQAIEQSIVTSQETARQQLSKQQAGHQERYEKDVRTFKWIGSLTIVGLVALVALSVIALLDAL